MRHARIILLVLVAGSLLAACGASDDDPKGPPGSASNPLAALPNPSPTRAPPTAEQLGEASASATSRSGEAAEPGTTAPKSTRTQQGSVAQRPKSSVAGKPATAVSRPNSERKQKALPAGASRPCSLVSKSQARAIVGADIVEPLQAPQGPTCIYQTNSGKTYITLAVQSVSFAKLRRQIRGERAVSIANRTAYCGTYGKPMLFLPLAGGRVLSITASCGLAKQFAATAAPRL